jgi:hypothetical protein
VAEISIRYWESKRMPVLQTLRSPTGSSLYNTTLIKILMIPLLLRNFRILQLVNDYSFKFVIAYEVLSDADKRRKYDKCGEDCVNQPEHQGGMNPFGDMFGDFFGGFM